MAGISKLIIAESLSLALINRKFPGMTLEELSRVFAICKDEATLEYERAQEMVVSMRETTAGYAALFALIELWRSNPKRCAPLSPKRVLSSLRSSIGCKRNWRLRRHRRDRSYSQICCRRLLNAAGTNLKSTLTLPTASCAATSRLFASKGREARKQASGRSLQWGARAVGP